MTPHKIHSQQAFTLMELLLAVFILAIIISTAWSALSNIIRSKDYLDDGREAQAIANAVITRMTRELQHATSDVALLPPREDPELRFPSSVNMIGTDDTIGADIDADKIEFMAKGAAQYLLTNQRYSDTVKITYRVEPDPDQRAMNAATYYLVREETPLIRPIKDAFKRSMIFPITNRLVGLNFRYYQVDDQAWLTNWDKDKERGLPSMIEFTVKILSPLREVKSYTTTVKLRSSSDAG